MKMIAAVDAKWAIGNKGKLLISIPQDMKHFRAHTLGKTVVMGRKTLESFPNQKPLPDRDNIVLTRNPRYEVKGAAVASDIDELFRILRSGSADARAQRTAGKGQSDETDAGGTLLQDTDDVYVIGGETIYRQLLPYCDTAYITKIDYAYEADAYFPNLDEDPEWELADESDEETYFNVCYTFCTYRRKAEKV
ncbi:MAG: dihydrofolate reductase [Lachnospiraceae bacterium]|nr:dihydrofolate reductase [Lachnospiraceae bacterium]